MVEDIGFRLQISTFSVTTNISFFLNENLFEPYYRKLFKHSSKSMYLCKSKCMIYLMFTLLQIPTGSTKNLKFKK